MNLINAIKQTKIFILLAFVFFTFMATNVCHGQDQQRNKEAGKMELHVPKSGFYRSINTRFNYGNNFNLAGMHVSVGGRFRKSVVSLGTGIQTFEKKDLNEGDVPVYFAISLDYKYYLWNKSASPFFGAEYQQKFRPTVSLMNLEKLNPANSLATFIGFRLPSRHEVHWSFSLGYEFNLEFSEDDDSYNHFGWEIIELHENHMVSFKVGLEF